MAKDKYNDTSKQNIEAIRSFRLKGEHIAGRDKHDKDSIGQIVKKSDFPNNASWQNLCAMDPARAVETSDKVAAAKSGKKSAPSKAAKADPALPGT